MHWKEYDDTVHDYKIWALICPKVRVAYVSETWQAELKDAKHKHLTRLCESTGVAVTACREAGGEPEVYVLETVRTTRAGVIERKLGWMRWLELQGNTVLAKGKLRDRLADVDLDDIRYQWISGIDVNQVLDPERDLNADTRTAAERKLPPSTGNVVDRYMMSLTVDGAMRQKIEHRSRELGVTFAAYIRGCVRDEGKDGCGPKTIDRFVDDQRDLMRYTNAVDQLCDTVITNRWCTAAVAELLADIQAQVHEDCRQVRRALADTAEAMAPKDSLL